VTPRYVRANPVEGGKQAVAEAFRNLCAVGARPLATTDNLNFGNPEKPEIMGQFVGAIKGIGAACRRSTCRSSRATSRSTTRPTDRRSCPPPRSARWGYWTASTEMIADTIREGHVALMVGETAGHLGPIGAAVGGLQPRRRRRAPCGPDGRAAQRRFHPRERGMDQRLHRPQRRGPRARRLRDGEAAGDVGVTLEAADTPTLFGEDQGRYLIACSFDKAEALMVAAGKAGVPMVTVGRVGGDKVKIGTSEAPLAELRAIWSGAFAGHFG
jgi:hypothetical protein